MNPPQRPFPSSGPIDFHRSACPRAPRHQPLLAAVALAASAEAATWNGGGANDSWTTAANWGGVAPVAGDALAFGGSTRLAPSNTFAADTSFASITFNNGAGAFTLGGNRITLAGSVTQNDASPQTLALDLLLGATRTFHTAAGELRLSNVVSGAGGITKTGSQLLRIEGGLANTYTGVTSINAGVVNIRKGSALGSSISGTVVASGAALQLQSNTGLTIIGEALTLNGGGVANDGALRSIAGNTTWSGSVSVQLLGAVSQGGGAANRIASDAGTLTLSGPVSVAAGTLANAAVLTLQGAGAGHISGDITGGIAGLDTVSRSSLGAGVWTLSGNNTFLGNVRIHGGTLAVSGGSAIPDSSLVNLTAAATLLLNAGETIGSLTGIAASVVQLNAHTLTVGADGTTPVDPVNGSSGFAGTLQGTGGLTKVGGGVLSLSGPNTYTGATTVNAGRLVTSGGSIPDASSVTLANVAGAELRLDSGETIHGLNGGGPLGGHVDLQGFTLAVGGSGSFAGTLVGAGRLVKSGPGTQALSGSNTHVGGVSVNQGVLHIHTGASALGAAPPAFVADHLLLNGGTLRVSTADAVLNHANRGMTVGAAGGTVLVDGGRAFFLSTPLAAGAGGSTLAKAGAGTFNLTANATLNALNVTGGRYVQSAGTTRVQTTSTGVAIQSGATYHLAGGTLRTDRIQQVSDGNFQWGAGILSPFQTNSGANNLGAFSSTGYQEVRSGVTLRIEGDTATSPGSVLALNASPSLYLNGDVRFNNLLVTGDLDLSAPGDTLGVEINPYLLRPFSPSQGAAAFESGSLPLVVVNGHLSGVFDDFGSVLSDSSGFQLHDGLPAFTSAANLPLNTWWLEYAQDVLDADGSLTGQTPGTYDVVFFHYRVSGYVPEPGSLSLMLIGVWLLRAVAGLGTVGIPANPIEEKP